MKSDIPSPVPLVINWSKRDDPDFWKWENFPPNRVVKLVLGPTPGNSDTKPLELTPRECEILNTRLPRFPALTHLYLWNLAGLKLLPDLPSDLECLDVRGCSDLETVSRVPGGLDTWVIEACPNLKVLPSAKDLPTFPQLRDLRLEDSQGVCGDPWFVRLLSQSPNLELLDLSGCARLTKIERWPERLKRIELNRCSGLSKLSFPLPQPLYRLGLRDAENLELVTLGPTGPRLAYLDLRGTIKLVRVPEFPSSLRTLYLHGSSLDLPKVLFQDASGTSPIDYNAASGILAHLSGNSRVVDHEVKVIILGDGRSGKSSLARRLVEDCFDAHEPTTHGIQLWPHKVTFRPLDQATKADIAIVNIWDFAGQDLYHNTHRLFLQSNAIFIICGNFCPPGADPATDKTDQNQLPEGSDLRRDVPYWREQIESLVTAPGEADAPPILVLRTKKDRDKENPSYKANFDRARAESFSDLENLEISAKTGENYHNLGVWLSRQIARVLGRRGERDISAHRLAIKREIQTRLDANAEAYREAEEAARKTKQRTRIRVRSPSPHMPRTGEDGFDAVFRRHCPPEAIADNPVECLRFFHRSGFVFFHEEYLPNEVVLDQRWAIDGMYGAFDREGAWHNLLACRGRFTAREMAEWIWNRRGFTPDEQALFLRYMLSCRMIFALGNNRLGEIDGAFLNQCPQRRFDYATRGGRSLLTDRFLFLSR